jgi:gamma-glutamyltranspeptidase
MGAPPDAGDQLYLAVETSQGLEALKFEPERLMCCECGTSLGGPPGASRYDRDTSYIVIVDKERNMVSFEPSLYGGFGTRVVMGDTHLIFNHHREYEQRHRDAATGHFHQIPS